MRFLLVLALAMAGLTLAASAQYRTPKFKPSHSDQGKQSKSAPAVKTPPVPASSAQQLHRLEQETARAASQGAVSPKPVHTTPVLKAEREKPNPPIHFSAGGGNREGMSKQGTNPYKGRLRQKGSH